MDLRNSIMEEVILKNYKLLQFVENEMNKLKEEMNHLKEENAHLKEENKLTEKELIDLPAKDKISWQDLSENQEAKKLLEAKFEKEQELSDNVLAQKIRTHKSLYLNWGGLSANPCAIDLLNCLGPRLKMYTL